MLFGQVRRIRVFGDSEARKIFESVWSFANLTNSNPFGLHSNLYRQLVPGRHRDFSLRVDHPAEASHVELEFHWRPFAANMTRSFQSASQNAELVTEFTPDHNMVEVAIFCFGLWDMLHTRSRQAFEEAASAIIVPEFRKFKQTSRVFWVNIPALVDSKLTPAKQPYMSAEKVADYNQILKRALLPPQQQGCTAAVDGMVDLEGMTVGFKDGSVDGIHFDPIVYDDVVRMVVLSL
jgi:uncharacterized protein (DUF1810 family)